jgi:hypothetical protein
MFYAGVLIYVVAILILCSIINGSAEEKLNTHTQSE